MAPTVRNSTRQNTIASAKKAKEGGYVRRPRPPRSRKQRYTRNKGLVSVKFAKQLRHITLANAANSPLLRLPPEIRNMIFKYAVARTGTHGIPCFFNRHDRVSKSGISTLAASYILAEMATDLPQVCRQIYSETATLVYSENIFVFKSIPAMGKWLAKRLRAQREAIRSIKLPAITNPHPLPLRITGPAPDEVFERAQRQCPNIVDVDADTFLGYNLNKETELRQTRECCGCEDYFEDDHYGSSGDESSCD